MTEMSLPKRGKSTFPNIECSHIIAGVQSLVPLCHSLSTVPPLLTAVKKPKQNIRDANILFQTFQKKRNLS